MLYVGIIYKKQFYSFTVCTNSPSDLNNIDRHCDFGIVLPFNNFIPLFGRAFQNTIKFIKCPPDRAIVLLRCGPFGTVVDVNLVICSMC